MACTHSDRWATGKSQCQKCICHVKGAKYLCTIREINRPYNCSIGTLNITGFNQRILRSNQKGCCDATVSLSYVQVSDQERRNENKEVSKRTSTFPTPSKRQNTIFRETNVPSSNGSIKTTNGVLQWTSIRQTSHVTDDNPYEPSYANQFIAIPLVLLLTVSLLLSITSYLLWKWRGKRRGKSANKQSTFNVQYRGISTTTTSSSLGDQSYEYSRIEDVGILSNEYTSSGINSEPRSQPFADSSGSKSRRPSKRKVDRGNAINKENILKGADESGISFVKNSTQDEQDSEYVSIDEIETTSQKVTSPAISQESKSVEAFNTPCHPKVLKTITNTNADETNSETNPASHDYFILEGTEKAKSNNLHYRRVSLAEHDSISSEPSVHTLLPTVSVPLPCASGDHSNDKEGPHMIIKQPSPLVDEKNTNYSQSNDYFVLQTIKENMALNNLREKKDDFDTQYFALDKQTFTYEKSASSGHVSGDYNAVENTTKMKSMKKPNAPIFEQSEFVLEDDSNLYSHAGTGDGEYSHLQHFRRSEEIMDVDNEYSINGADFLHVL